MKTNKFKIIVRGGYGRTNFGDDALMYVIHKYFLNDFTESELAYNCKKVRYLKNYIGSYQIIPIENSINKKSEIVIYGGGTQFYSFKTKNKKPNKFIRLLSLISKPKKIVIKIRNKIFSNKFTNCIEQKKIAIGIGIGPFLDENMSKEIEIKELFQNMDFVAVRDKFSYNKCKEWGVKNLKLYSDLCYALEVSQNYKTVKYLSKILIIIRDWNLTNIDENYKNELIKVANTFKEKNIEVSFSIFAKNKDKNWLKFIRDKSQPLLMWNPDKDNVESFIHQLDNYDLFITSRYHGAVFSTILGKPFIAIDIEQKLKLFYELNKKGSELWTNPFNASELIEKIEKINNNYSTYVNNIKKVAAEQKKLALDLRKKLNAYLNQKVAN